MHIVIVKTSSMGDVIHALPVVSDIVAAIPAAQIDWVVEESFAQIPAWHPNVQRVLSSAIRRWRRSLGAAQTWTQMRELRRQLRELGRCDVVLDLQGLYKSALLTRLITGKRVGFSSRCAREPLAARLYDECHDVDMTAPAIERLRQLAAASFGYRLAGLPQFNLRIKPGLPPNGLAGDYAVLLHATSRAEKLWPSAQWQGLIAALNARGITVVLPWANPRERTQAEQLAGLAKLSYVPPALSLTECAQLMQGARVVVGVDTGLTHLAAALGRPTVSVFGATEAARFGPYWSACAINLGDRGRWPDHAEVSAALAPWIDTSEARV